VDIYLSLDAKNPTRTTGGVACHRRRRKPLMETRAVAAVTGTVPASVPKRPLTTLGRHRWTNHSVPRVIREQQPLAGSRVGVGTASDRWSPASPGADALVEVAGGQRNTVTGDGSTGQRAGGGFLPVLGQIVTAAAHDTLTPPPESPLNPGGRVKRPASGTPGHQTGP